MRVFGNPLGTSISVNELDFSLLNVVASGTVTTKADSLDITGLDINTDGIYLFLIQHQNDNAAAGALYSWYINDDVVAANYDREQQYSQGGVDGGSNDSDAGLTYAHTNMGSVNLVLMVRDYDGVIWMMSLFGTNAAAAMFMGQRCVRTVGTKANVTKITLSSSQTDGIGVGTRYWVFKI